MNALAYAWSSEDTLQESLLFLVTEVSGIKLRSGLVASCLDLLSPLAGSMVCVCLFVFVLS